MLVHDTGIDSVNALVFLPSASSRSAAIDSRATCSALCRLLAQRDLDWQLLSQERRRAAVHHLIATMRVMRGSPAG